MKRSIWCSLAVILACLIGGGLITRAGAQRSLRQTLISATPTLSTADTASNQAIAGDLTITAAAYGSSTAATPSYVGAIMGNLISTQALSATKNLLFGVLGKYDHTGASSSTYPGAALVGELGDGVTAAYAGILAVVGGDTTAVTAVAAYGVDWQSSVPASRFNFGLDLQGNGTHDGYAAPRYNQAALRLGGRWQDSNNATVFTANNICLAIVNSAPVNGTSGTRAGTCGPGSLLIRADDGTLFQNTNTLASPTWTAR